MNKLVKRVLGSTLAERRLAGGNPNWTELLGKKPTQENNRLQMQRGEVW
jgi:hypothetical protein